MNPNKSEGSDTHREEVEEDVAAPEEADVYTMVDKEGLPTQAKVVEAPRNSPLQHKVNQLPYLSR